MVPGVLLLVARDLLVHDPPRILAWRLLHDPRLAAAWPAWLTPHPPAGLDRDPVALLLAALATALATVYLAAALLGARPLVRGALIGLASLVLVVAPTAAFVAMGVVTDRPYGQDGGVVQLPLAIDRILAGESPYGADYSDSMLGKQARASEFWAPYGGNPILRHHAYLPGTHLLMLPFHVASRGLFGLFDPRSVTLLAYGIAVLLAVSLVDGATRRLSAAAAVALNPLVYWHQIFGANDVLFAAILLGSAWLARRGRPVASGAALGLACATKQLAWPFAPFLLIHLSGARTFRELAGREAGRRLAAPALAAAAVFVAIVAPVVALGPRAFWGDIVVYNVGLAGGDNYPLGGTPGFGFANFLLYFGAVSSLRDSLPFGIFYLLLVPLVLLLARVQLREGGATTALLTGSAALVAVLYFSRVVHPNYLVGAAVLAPVGLLAGRRPADLALVPLLLLGLAAETAEQQLFRATWDQAVAARLPAYLTGLAALLAPRAGPHLSPDPLGLAASGLAAGLAVAGLAAAVTGAPARVRAAFVTLSTLLVVALPTAIVGTIGGRTGAPRAQDAWVVQARADAARIARGRSPYARPFDETPTGRQAWSTSFSLGPPRLLAPDHPLVPPGAAIAAAALRPLGVGDPRTLSLLALALLLAALWRLTPPERRPTALGAAALGPFLAVGVPFGAPEALTVAALAGAALAALSGRPVLAGTLAGVAAGLDHGALPAAPFVVLPTLADAAPGTRPRAATAAALAYAALVVPVALLDPGAFAEAWSAGGDVGPGVGLSNLLLFAGARDATAAHAVFAAAPLLVALATGALLIVARRHRASPFGLAAVATLVGLLFAREGSAESLALPATLALLAVLRSPDTGLTPGS